jgi:hypothetical protein
LSRNLKAVKDIAHWKSGDHPGIRNSMSEDFKCLVDYRKSKAVRVPRFQ